MQTEARKLNGAYYTPEGVVASLVRWVVRRPADRMLDPSCGDGRFLARHRNSTGVEQDSAALLKAMAGAPWATIHEADFFAWAEKTSERFDCAAGNPPFIRYQRWTGVLRQRALDLCARHGAVFSSLSSSWAPFLVAATSVLRAGGRMAFVVPAEIGHATYAVPLLEYLVHSFSVVHLVAVQDRIFSGLSEDCWLLYADGFGGHTDHIRLTRRQSFCHDPRVPRDFEWVSLTEWRLWRSRLRPFLLPGAIRSLYRELSGSPAAIRLGDVARVGIGYVTGANAFFHLRPSEAARGGIPQDFLHPSVRNGASLPPAAVTHATVRAWLNQDKPVLLLRIREDQILPAAVKRYLETPEAMEARQAYKCRTRNPWYVVPDVHVPDAFLSYMSGQEVSLVANHAKCVGTNSVHTIRLNNGMSVETLRRGWASSLARLSCELEGHPLGGGLLKLEPREAANLAVPNVRKGEQRPLRLLDEGVDIMRQWRHYGQGT